MVVKIKDRHFQDLIITQDHIEKFMHDFFVDCIGIHCTSSYEFNVRVHHKWSMFMELQKKRIKCLGYLLEKDEF